MISFSIVIPVYKTKEYLDQCVQSVIAQNYENFEIILVDDGSPDCCGQMCDAWAKKDARIKVIHQENSGLSAARNTGIRQASGDYVMFLDSDDWWNTPDFLGKIVAQLEKTQAQVLSLNYRKIWSSGKEQTYFPCDLAIGSGDLSTLTNNQLWVACAWNKAVSKNLYLQHDLFFITGILSEDIDWCMRLAVCAEQFAYLDEHGISYRQREGSLSHVIYAERVEGLCQNVEECLRLLRNAEEEKAEMLKPYVAFQYATVLHNYAGLPSKMRNSALMNRVKALLHLLGWAENRKVKMLKLANHLLGFSGMMWLLRVRQRLQRG